MTTNIKKISHEQFPKDGKLVATNQQSGARFYEKDGKYYWSDVLGIYESDSLEELRKEEAKIDPRLGWR